MKTFVVYLTLALSLLVLGARIQAQSQIDGGITALSCVYVPGGQVRCFAGYGKNGRSYVNEIPVGKE